MRKIAIFVSAAMTKQQKVMMRTSGKPTRTTYTAYSQGFLLL